MEFFTADTHINHRGILDHCARPWKNIWAMNSVIVKNWNSVVGKEDIVYHLGDVAWGRLDETEEILNELNGRIVLIEGSHDRQLIKKLPHLFEAIYRIHDISPRGHHIVLCHYCMRTWPKSHYNSWHLYAHSHGRLSPVGKSHDVGVDNNAFFPLSIFDIEKIMEKRFDNPNFVGS